MNENMRDPNQKVSVDKATGRVRVQTINLDPSMTQQQFKDECDVNKIMEKYTTTGQFTHLTSKEGRYADFSQITDYRDMLMTIKYADEAFMLLPANVRTRFRNDPGQLLAFIQDQKNYDEAVELGLVNPKIVKTKERVVNDDSNDDKPALKLNKKE